MDPDFIATVLKRPKRQLYGPLVKLLLSDFMIMPQIDEASIEESIKESSDNAWLSIDRALPQADASQSYRKKIIDKAL